MWACWPERRSVGLAEGNEAAQGRLKPPPAAINLLARIIKRRGALPPLFIRRDGSDPKTSNPNADRRPRLVSPGVPRATSGAAAAGAPEAAQCGGRHDPAPKTRRTKLARSQTCLQRFNGELGAWSGRGSGLAFGGVVGHYNRWRNLWKGRPGLLRQIAAAPWRAEDGSVSPGRGYQFSGRDYQAACSGARHVFAAFAACRRFCGEAVPLRIREEEEGP